METPRRVVTRVDVEGKSALVSDDKPPICFCVGDDNEIEIAELWATQCSEKLPVDGSDPTQTSPAFLPAPGETRFRIVKIEPTKSFKLEDALHRADVVEYLIVLSGEIQLVLADRSEICLRSGNCIIQAGTEHAWRNQTDVPCVIAVVLIGASTISRKQSS